VSSLRSNGPVTIPDKYHAPGLFIGKSDIHGIASALLWTATTRNLKVNSLPLDIHML
jgi:hypothetical protein